MMRHPRNKTGMTARSQRLLKQGGVAIGMMIVLAACNTVQGLGQDIESVGRKGEEVIKGE